MTTIALSVGQVRGTQEKGVFAFKGIPYAEPIAGRARWLPPKPRVPWNGTFDATRYGGACMQFGRAGRVLPFPRDRARYLRALDQMKDSPQSDDCLVLNVWSPTLDPFAKLPVMVWIHGGGFASGAANAFYDAAHFAARGAVAVVIQYRLGPLGFLHGSGLFDDDVCADNRAFLDQMLALSWVQQNIARFGGNPGNVTLFGESAGAFAIYQLAASPQAKGLFHRAIGMGGMAQTCAPAGDYHRLTRDALAQVGVKAGEVAALAALDAKQLQQLHQAMVKGVLDASDPDRYGELTRTKVGFLGAATDTPFLPKPPLAVYPTGTPNDIDLMLGTCANDGGLFSLTMPIPSMGAKLFSGYFSGLAPNRDLDAMRAHYRAQLNGISARRFQDQINNDIFYRGPTLNAAVAHAAGHPGRTFHYQLDYASIIPGLGAIHAIDVALLFRSPWVRHLVADDVETRRLADAMVDAWISFAKTGKPQARGLPEWRAFDRKNRLTMVLDRQSRLAHDLDSDLLSYLAQ